ncbi:MAG: Glucuronate isomerase [Bacteroidetes bacterium]|uniref:glucuronate isomerase n=1 Tax=unclassified Chitinophaga TaxID=2619133 RepID=UPI0009CDF78F|nr:MULTISPECIES: glucuronate isomerase [unclassified Chitinophaga]MBP1650541.1 Glucuronate isomerase [Bacteroidota bacterium]OMP79905.1 glucuronate isomerase [[Flexibacter] sp. ATCC 35208]WPV64153.1 glucuronate isomerase [Chitinophaga sp. LS1]
MKQFLDEHFLLSTATSRKLYHDYAKEMPVIDYHCHLPPAQIAADTAFENITQAWLYGDHYKWRAMRTNGVHESYCTGDRSDWEKFEKWAATVPYTLRNPLYHWTHLELQRYFGVNEILNTSSAPAIYATCNELLQTKEYTTRNLLRKMKVALVCTTDDPADTLEYHRQLKEDGFEIPILPAFRPDQAMNVDDPAKYNAYLQKLEQAADTSISTYQDLLTALKSRHDFFAGMGCSVSDHGIEEIYADDYSDTEINNIFTKVRSGQQLTLSEIRQIKSALLVQLAIWDWEKGWVQQYHLGALRNNNSRMMRQLGPDTGWDSIGDFSQARALAKFLDRLDSQDQLAKTILYNLNPSDNELLATMIGNFNDGSVAGKVQFGSAWWFLDQKDGMIRQINALSNMGLLSRFVGMLTDSRSFLSYPRHEYFRRIVCELFGQEIENGELPNDVEWVGKVIQDICFYNAQQYFNWK